QVRSGTAKVAGAGEARGPLRVADVRRLDGELGRTAPEPGAPARALPARQVQVQDAARREAGARIVRELEVLPQLGVSWVRGDPAEQSSYHGCRGGLRQVSPRSEAFASSKMAYKIYLLDNLSPIEWSQAVWRLEGAVPTSEDCDRELIHDVMLRHLPQDGLIADAGCGAGRWPIHLRRLGYRVVGIDISPEAGRAARAEESGLPITVGDVRRVPLKDGSVDAVLSLRVVEHDERGPDEALREARRILKPGGLLILSVPFNNLFRRVLVNRLQSWVTWRRRRALMRLGFVEYRFTRREVRECLQRTGFRVGDAHVPESLRWPGTLVRARQRRRGRVRARDGDQRVVHPVHHQQGGVDDALGMADQLVLRDPAGIRRVELEGLSVHAHRRPAEK